VVAGVGRSASGPGEVRGDGALDELALEPFTEEEALVRKPVAGVFSYERAAVDRILQRNRLRPYPIQRLCLHAVNRMLDEGRTTVRMGDVEAASGGEPGCQSVQCS